MNNPKKPSDLYQWVPFRNVSNQAIVEMEYSAIPEKEKWRPAILKESCDFKFGLRHIEVMYEENCDEIINYIYLVYNLSYCI